MSIHHFDHIILIDDEEAALFYHSIMAEEADVADSILTARNGIYAVEILHDVLKNNKRILVFLDINMPAISGWEVLESLQIFEEKDLSRTFIYLVTASQHPKDLEKIKDYPFVKGLIMKPISAEKIIEISKCTTNL